MPAHKNYEVTEEHKASGKALQFRLLLWKNYLIQKRSVVRTSLEIGLPTLFSLLLIGIRQITNGTPITNTTSWLACDIEQLPKPAPFSPSLPRKLAYSPNNPIMERIMKSVEQRIGVNADASFATESDMVTYLMFANGTVNNTRDYLGGIVFSGFNKNSGVDKLPHKIEYTIRLSSSPRNAGKQKSSLNPFNTDTRWMTRANYPQFQKVGPREKNHSCGGMPGYQREGFLTLQNAISYAVFEELAPDEASDLINMTKMSVRRHPYPPYNDDPFVLVIQKQFPLVLMLSFIITALSIVKDVVHEKERKLKESMKMMGLSNWLHWMAWFIKYLLFSLISIILMTIFFSVRVGPKHENVIGNTDPFILFLFLIIYCISAICFCFAVSVFFKKANSAAAAGGILFFCSYIPYFFIQNRYDTMTWGEKMAACIDFQVAMAFGGQVIGMFEGIGSGVQWSNLDQGVSVDDNFALLHILLMMLFDSVLYCAIAWYVEAVFPGEFGVPQKWYFFLTRSYWCGTKQRDDVDDSKDLNTEKEDEYFEKDPVSMRPGISIRNLSKEFGTGEACKKAVSGMTLDMYEGQITALLGHNGAGKTTTMSMLTGFIPPTGGTARVNGYDIREDIVSVRSSLGLCPQHDILFDSLTVEEHLNFFAKLKGVPSAKVASEVDLMLNNIGLQPKRKAQSRTLSGGMKRKLSVGIALIGGSKVVILDEPSSGMDPDARRHIWTVLQNNRAGRTMVLTTHFMDEADLLGDRIAIMAEGVVKCCGSSLFLKNKYGAGYHMVIVKEPQCVVGNITALVTKYIPEAELESNIGAELSYILPQESSHRFEELFTQLQLEQKQLGISSFGASVTTMEEVFLRVGEDNNSHLRERLQKGGVNLPVMNGSPGATGADNMAFDMSSNSSINTHLDLGRELRRNAGIALYVQQFRAMFVKRFLHTFRNKLVTASQLIVPLFFTVMALIVLKTFPGPTDSPALKLTIDQFKKNYVPYATALNPDESLSNLAAAYVNQFGNSSSALTYINNFAGFKKDPDIIKYLSKKGEEGIGNYNIRYVIAASFEEGAEAGISNATAYFQNQAYHSPAIALATVASAVLQYITNDSSYSMEVTNHPLPRTDMNRVNDELTQGTEGFTIAFNVCFGMAFLASSFVLFLVKERSVKAKHIQFVSGVHAFNFWAATFCWDMFNYLVPCILLIISFAAFQIDAYIVDFHWAGILLLFVMYGWAMLPFMYLMSFIFSVPASAYVWISMFNILSGVATVLTVGILAIPQLELEDTSRILEWIFMSVLPNFCLGQGLEDFYSNYEFLQICQRFKPLCKFAPTMFCCDECVDSCLYNNENYFGWAQNGIGRMLIFLAIQGVVYFSLLFAIELNLFKKLFYAIRNLGSGSRRSSFLSRQLSNTDSRIQEDSDVATERARLANQSLHQLFQSDKLLLQEVVKDYDINRAVDHISVGIPQGECFGLLGVNGAGKTTTFKMLTGDEILTGGNAFLDGFSVKSDTQEVQQRLGYCPQFDALIGQLTGRETLTLYARLRGVMEREIAGTVNNLINSLLLTDHADKLAQAYSGGNKRKLSTAIALVGNPPIIFLDEPTTGMDPVARRLLWDALATVRDSGRTLVLTSHSMEECEALCTRIAIMVNGQFKCLGSTQHLKNKFGEGYTLMVKVSYPEGDLEPDLEPLRTFIEGQFPGSILKDIHQCMLHYHITDTRFTWAQLFGTMERAKDTYHIEDYLVGQTTLEQVFINFARSQKPPNEAVKGCMSWCC
ncbi:phospholipid-transporting ATPase ABCA3-like [Haliotis cracherodii]|uniref:phospholipid-transporting ATPase ABCA3-like n=1 Tax=Haliotis cracherodii TaxID=6455 RepID=UPI0039E9E163